ERNVGADVEAGPDVGPLRRRGAPRIDGVQPRAVPNALQHMMEEDRMRLPRVRAPEENTVRLLDLLIGARPAACSEDRRQTDDSRGVSGAGTAVGVGRG